MNNEKDSFFSSLDEQKVKERDDFIAHMSRPREKVEAPDFELPGFEEDEISTDSPPPSEDSLLLEYNAEQLWTAELILFKVDEIIAWLLAIWSGQSPDKYRKRKTANAAKDDREVQLAAALLNKYQMKMSLEWAFLSLFIMGYAPVFIQAGQDAKKGKNVKVQSEPPKEQEKESKK